MSTNVRCPESLRLIRRPCSSRGIRFERPGGRTHNHNKEAKEKAEPKGCYWYANNQVVDTAIGMEYTTDISKPHVSSFNDYIAHSIDQLAVGAGTEGNQYTIEVGWDVDPGLFELEQVEEEKREVEKHEKEQVTPPENPHFFILVNNDKYKECEEHSKCYDPTSFVPAEGAKITPGATLEPSTSKFRLGVEYRSPCFQGATGGCWWISAANQWIGYVPASAWGNNFTHGTSEANYGEVFERRNPNDPDG